MTRFLLALGTALAIFLLVLGCSGNEKALQQEQHERSLLSGIGQKKKKKRKLTKADRKMERRKKMKKHFQKVIGLYFDENLEAFSEQFDNELDLVGRTLEFKEPRVKKDEYLSQVKKTFSSQELDKVEPNDIFDFERPNRFFILTYDQFQKKIPVWNFFPGWEDIKPFVKKGDWMGIAKVDRSGVKAKVYFPDSYFYVFRKIDGNWRIVATE